MPTKHYLFQLGNTPTLSFAELVSLLKTPIRLTEYVALAELQDDQAAIDLIDKLGGTVKIAKVLSEHDNLTKEEAESKVIKTLSSEKTEKISFAIGELGRHHLEAIDHASIKNALLEQGFKVRYREGSREGLSAAVLGHQKVKEILVVASDSATFIAQTVAVQNIDDWTIRDRSKPYADRQKGMLPPKVARILVNLAEGALDPSLPKKLLDPFCGTGTVLLEGMHLGWECVGSDADPEAAKGTRENVIWYKETYSDSKETPVYQEEAANLSLQYKISAVVTEPFLGKQTPKPHKIPNIIRGLEKLYIGAAKNFSKLLEKNGVVVMIMPAYELKGNTVTVSRFVDKLPSLGYTIVSGPVTYARPGAQVQRHVYVLRYTG